MSDLLNALRNLGVGEEFLSGAKIPQSAPASPKQTGDGFSAIIPSRNEGGKTARTVRSLVHGRSSTFPLEVVVVDDASEDGSCGTLTDIAQEAPDVTVVVHRLNRWSGIPFARNRGAEIARHPAFLVTDANTVFPRNWDVPVRRYLQPNRILCGTVVDERSGHKGYGLTLELPSMGVTWITEPGRFGGYVPVAPCTCSILERALFHSLGGYDETMPLYGAAEPEFSVRAWLAGAEIVNLPDLFVGHRFRPVGARNEFFKANWRTMLKNYVRFAWSYLPDSELRRAFDYYGGVMGVGEFEQCMNELAREGISQRRTQLRQALQHDFSHFAAQFALYPTGTATGDPPASQERRRHPRTPSSDPSALSHSRAAVDETSASRIVVYTAVFGDYDELEPPKNADVEYVCFTDQPDLKAPGWVIRPVRFDTGQLSDDDRTRLARRFKLLPHEYLPEYRYWIWQDANTTLLCSPKELVARYLNNADLATFKHQRRDCIYVEAEGLIRAGKDNEDTINRHVERYRMDGYPRQAGLIWSAVLVRRNTSAVRLLNESWWAELATGSRRDQLSFNYVARRLGFHYATMPLEVVRSKPHKYQRSHQSSMRVSTSSASQANLTLVLLNWRPQNLKILLDSIDCQTQRPKIFVWNNGGRFSDPRIDWAIDSSENKRCWPRWTIGAMADTEFVCSVDDDLAFGDARVIEDLLQYMRSLDEPDRLVGAYGVILEAAKPYNKCTHVASTPNVNIAVDIVKGKMLACRRETLQSMAMISEPREDDIAVSGLAAHGRPLYHRVPALFHNRLRELPELGIGLSHQPEHNQSREAARRKYFPSCPMQPSPPPSPDL